MRDHANPIHQASVDRIGHAGAAYWQTGASLLELAIVVTVISFLAVAFFRRFSYTQEYAEKAAMELTIENMRAGLRAQVGALLMSDRTAEIASLAGGNPVLWLEEQPENYLGETQGQPQVDAGGKWYFDRRQRELVYTPNLRRHFDVPLDGVDGVRVKVVPVTQTGATATPGEPRWVQLAVTNDERWF